MGIEERNDELERIKRWLSERRKQMNIPDQSNSQKQEEDKNNRSFQEEQVSAHTQPDQASSEMEEKSPVNPSIARIFEEWPPSIIKLLKSKQYPKEKKEWLLELPWTMSEADPLDLELAALILEESHYGLGPIKQRLYEHLAVQHHVQSAQGTVLLLVGPPGVGKTSIAKAIARALNRPFSKINMGGIHASFELKGAISSWKNAQPGLIVKSLRQTKSLSSVILLDELDKMGASDIHGEASAALLEILDSDRTGFFDNYLEAHIDLTNVFFIATANNLNDISPIVRDRMEIIQLSGYSLETKMSIARNYIIPRKFKQFRLSTEAYSVSDDALRHIIMRYCTEPGIRGLEQIIGDLCRKLVYQFVTGKSSCLHVERGMVAGLLGKPAVMENYLCDKPEIGVTNALGVLGGGQGIVFPVEISSIAGDGDVIYTGGFSESCEDVFELVMTVVKSIGNRWGYNGNDFDDFDIHVHAYWPGIKKEGSSIGLAFFVAFLSSLMQIPVRHDIALTGELTLRGRLMPIGGVESKISAAIQAGLTTVIIPQANWTQVEALDESIRESIVIIMIDNLDDLVAAALIPDGIDPSI